jgi:hypothetical protein
MNRCQPKIIVVPEISTNKKAGLKGPASHYVVRARLSFYLQFKIAPLLLIM